MEEIRDPHAGTRLPEGSEPAGEEVNGAAALSQPASAGAAEGGQAAAPQGTEGAAPESTGLGVAQGGPGAQKVGQPTMAAAGQDPSAPDAGADGDPQEAVANADAQASGGAEASHGTAASTDQPSGAPVAAGASANGAPLVASTAAQGAETSSKEGAGEATGAGEGAAIGEQMAPTRLNRGQLVTGTVVQVAEDHVLVDVGHKSDGTIPRSELRLLGGKQPDQVYRVGDQIPVVVLGFADKAEGSLLLSHRRAVERQAWDQLRQAFEAGEPIEVPVVEQVKGGLVCDAGVRAFMPASHVERGYVADLSGYVGTTVRAKIIELDRNKRRVILSRKELLEEEARRRAEETLASLEEGQVRAGVVKGLTDFGAFVDLGGVDGLLHVSEMHWGRIDHPRDLLKEGDTIQVKVLKVDRERGRISLSLKELMPDPWETVESTYPPGSTVRGRVVRIVPFGAFVRLEPGIEGLVHISQLADHRVESPEEVVREGQEVEVRVLRVQPEERRISLSMRSPAEHRNAPARAERPRRERERPLTGTEGAGPSNGGGVTIGEMFGELLEETRDRLRGDRDDGN